MSTLENLLNQPIRSTTLVADNITTPEAPAIVAIEELILPSEAAIIISPTSREEIKKILVFFQEGAPFFNEHSKRVQVTLKKIINNIEENTSIPEAIRTPLLSNKVALRFAGRIHDFAKPYTDQAALNAKESFGTKERIKINDVHTTKGKQILYDLAASIEDPEEKMFFKTVGNMVFLHHCFNINEYSFPTAFSSELRNAPSYDDILKELDLSSLLELHELFITTAALSLADWDDAAKTRKDEQARNKRKDMDAFIQRKQMLMDYKNPIEHIRIYMRISGLDEKQAREYLIENIYTPLIDLTIKLGTNQKTHHKLHKDAVN